MDRLQAGDESSSPRVRAYGGRIDFVPLGQRLYTSPLNQIGSRDGVEVVRFDPGTRSSSPAWSRCNLSVIGSEIRSKARNVPRDRLCIPVGTDHDAASEHQRQLAVSSARSARSPGVDRVRCPLRTGHASPVPPLRPSGRRRAGAHAGTVSGRQPQHRPLGPRQGTRLVPRLAPMRGSQSGRQFAETTRSTTDRRGHCRRAVRCSNALPAPDGPESVEFDREVRRARFRQAAAQVRREVQPAAWQAFWDTSVLGVSSAETAAKLGMTVGALRVARCRVLARLRSAVAELDMT